MNGCGSARAQGDYLWRNHRNAEAIAVIAPIASRLQVRGVCEIPGLATSITIATPMASDATKSTNPAFVRRRVVLLDSPSLVSFGGSYGFSHMPGILPP